MSDSLSNPTIAQTVLIPACASISNVYEINGRPSSGMSGLGNPFWPRRSREPDPAIRTTASEIDFTLAGAAGSGTHPSSYPIILFQSPIAETLWKKAKYHGRDLGLKDVA